MNTRRLAFKTFGCKLNFSETENISRLFPDEYQKTSFQEEADVYVINTCSVTGNAENKCKQAIRSARKKNPEAIIAVVGCFSQLPIY